MEQLPIPGVTNVWALILQFWDKDDLMGFALWGAECVRVRCVAPDSFVLWRVAWYEDRVRLRVRVKVAEEGSETGEVAIGTLTSSTGTDSDALSATTGREEEGELAVLLLQPMWR